MSYVRLLTRIFCSFIADSNLRREIRSNIFSLLDMWYLQSGILESGMALAKRCVPLDIANNIHKNTYCISL